MPDDARLLELTWLSQLEDGAFHAFRCSRDSAEERLGLYLVAREFVTSDGGHLFEGLARMRRRLAGEAHPDDDSPDKTKFNLRITHAGSVRRAELEEQLKSGRIKEPMGLIWDGRHFHRDTRIALLDTSPEWPLAVVYLDLNDVKTFNAIGHATGDAAIRRYLEIVADLSYDRGDAYRLSGGADEVVVLLPRTDEAAALAWTRKLIGALGREVVESWTLRAAAGVVVATDPGEAVDTLKHRADAEQGRAKATSREREGRPSCVAWAAGLELG